MEFKLFKSEVDYEYIFNNLEYGIKVDLYFLTNYYYISLLEKLKDSLTLNLIIPNVKSINGIPVKVYLYIVKDYKTSVDNINERTNMKIGLNVCLNSKDYYTIDTTESLQTIYFLNCDTTDKEVFINYIYNLLFYTHIIMNEFCYNPLLKNIYHREDIQKFAAIKSAHIRLFGEFEQCSVCLENTTSMTECKHMLCQKCACSLVKKICPICRRSIDNEDDLEVHFYIT